MTLLSVSTDADTHGLVYYAWDCGGQLVSEREKPSLYISKHDSYTSLTANMYIYMYEDTEIPVREIRMTMMNWIQSKRIEMGDTDTQ